MRPHRLCRAVVLLGVVCTPVTAIGQTIAGWVVDDGTSVPLSAVAVMLLDSTDVAVALAESDSAGRFSMEAPRAGMYRVRADRLGYGDLISEVFSLDDAGPVELVVRMVPEPLEVAGLVVTAEQRMRTELEEVGFFRRRNNSLGYFFDAEELERIRPLVVTDVLRRVPSVRVSGSVVRSLRSYKPTCSMKIVLNGFKIENDSTADLNFLVNTDLLIGIEVYPGAGGIGAPVQHRGTDAFCGIVMIWTR